MRLSAPLKEGLSASERERWKDVLLLWKTECAATGFGRDYHSEWVDSFEFHRGEAHQ